MRDPLVSIIIVQYKVKNLLLECISSIKRTTKNTSYEIIIVDNDEAKNLKEDLLRKFPDVIYIPNENKGFGQGNNVGVTEAKGKYLFFLNPDTIISRNAISEQVLFIWENRDVGIVAPALTDRNEKIYKLQGFGELTFLRGLIALSFLNMFLYNILSKNYWLPNWDQKKIKEVGVVPGTAFMIKKDLYKKIGGFDENFFLYFEEFDLCKRVKDLGYRICMVPQAKVMHLWGESTKQRSDINAIFQDSRFYYFKKHFGVFKACIVECFTRASKEAAILTFIIIASLLLSLWKITTDMLFIGDQAWFYISARDLLLGKSFPLVGITSSHTWLHQGPLWTYILAVALWIGKNSPLAGVYLSIGINVLTIFFTYILGKKIVSKQTALLAAFFYAFSPYLIGLSRMPYHTTPIPMLTLFYFYALYKWSEGKIAYFPWIIFILALLYNFELATVMLVGFLSLVGLFGIIKKKIWITKFTKKELKLSLILGTIPLVPVLIFDFTHGFKQTVVFLGWLIFSGVKSFIHIFSSDGSVNSSSMLTHFLLERLNWLIFLPNYFFSNTILLISIVGLCVVWYQKYKKNDLHVQYLLLLLWLVFPIVVFILNKTPSDAYLPVIFPALFLCVAVTTFTFLQKRRMVLLMISVGFVLLNVFSLLKHNYSMYKTSNLTLAQREMAVESIIAQSHGKDFSLSGKGQGSQFESFVMPYEYLLWYKKHLVSQNASQIFFIEEKGDKILISKEYD